MVSWPYVLRALALGSTTNSPTVIFPKKGKLLFLSISNKKKIRRQFFLQNITVTLCFIIVVFIVNRPPWLSSCKLKRWSSPGLTQTHKITPSPLVPRLGMKSMAMDLSHPFSTFGTNTIRHLIVPQRKSKAYQCIKKSTHERGKISPSWTLLATERSPFHNSNSQSPFGKGGLDKTNPSQLYECQTVTSKLLSEWQIVKKSGKCQKLSD